MKKLQMILVAVLVIVASGASFFSFSYRQAEAKQPELKDQINVAIMQLSVAKQENNLDPLKEQLSKLQAEMKLYEKPLFLKKAPSVEVGDLVVDTADKFSLQLLKLIPNATAGTKTIKSSQDSEGNKYSVAEYDVKVQGRLGRINSLVNAIEAAEFATLTIEDMDISLLEGEGVAPDMWQGEFTIVNLYQYSVKK